MKKAKQNKELVKQLTTLIVKGSAHASLDDVLANLSDNKAGIVPGKLPYSVWQLAEHIRIVQWDMLEFCSKPDHVSPPWPEGYWPKIKKPSETAWKNCIKQIKKDRKAFIALLEDADADLYAPFPYGDGQTLLQEALQLADHTAYHAGEILVVRRLLGEWQS